jgi:ABC-type polysaccharide/polyol phosphate transport system ATPase subunit
MFLGMTVNEIARKQAEIAEFSELGEYLDLPVRTYSTGMVCRLCFAIATAIEPDILLLDEGLAAGDAGFAARAEVRMQTMISRAAILVLATHSEALIRSMCNRALLLQKGRLVAMGQVDEIIKMYHSCLTNSAMQVA